MSDVATTRTNVTDQTFVTATARGVTHLRHGGPLLLPLPSPQPILVRRDVVPHHHFDDLCLRFALSCMTPPTSRKTKSCSFWRGNCIYR